MSKNINNILIPNVTRIPGQEKVDVTNRLNKTGDKSEFGELLKSKVEQSGEQKPLHGGISLSTHAAKRLAERQIDFNGEEYLKVKNAMTK